MPQDKVFTEEETLTTNKKSSVPESENVDNWLDTVPERVSPLPSPRTATMPQGPTETVNAPDTMHLIQRRVNGVQHRSVDADKDGGSSDNDDRSDASMESDYYYDDQGKSHTYYRPKSETMDTTKDHHYTTAQEMHPVDNKNNEVNATAKSAPQQHSMTTQAAVIEISNTPKSNPVRRNLSQKSKGSSLPQDNGSIYLAPPSTKNQPTRENSAIGRSSAKSVPSEALAGLPEHLKGLGKNIHRLKTEELLHISAMVSRKANREVYSVLQYSGEAWYLPEVRRVRPEEPRWEFRYDWDFGLIISVAGMRLRIRLLSYLLRLAVMALIWFVVWASTIPKSWSYRVGYFLDPYVTVLISAIVGGLVCRLLHIPPLLGVLWMGIIWNNIPHVGYFTSGILPQVRTITARSGLAVILLRAGYSLNFKAITPILGSCLLASVALAVDTVVHALMAQYYLEYNDWKWSFFQGVLGAVPAAAVVVPGVLLLQADGYSRSNGPLPIMLASIGIETPLGIWGANFLYGLMSSDKSIGFEAGMGPVQIVGGAIAGAIAGAVVHLFVLLVRHEAQRLPGTKQFTDAHMHYVKWMAVFFIFLFGNAAMFLGYEIGMAGGGVVATTVIGFVVSHTWSNMDEEWLELKKNVGFGLASVWDLASMPLLFSLAGSKINLSKVFNKTMFPKALLLFVVVSAARVLYTIFIPSLGLGMTWSEKAFHGVSFGFAKATVQMAMASNAIDYVTKQVSAQAPLTNGTLSDELQHKLDMANMIQATIVLFVLLAVPISSICMTVFGPRVLRRG